MTRPAPRAYCFDLEGTLYADGVPMPGAAVALARLRSRGVPLRFITNTTSRSRQQLVERLNAFGISATPDEVFSAVVAGAHLAAARGHVTIAPFVPRNALADLDRFTLAGGMAETLPPLVPDAIIVGDLGGAWGYALMQEAYDYLVAGADFITLSRDRVFHSHDKLVLDAGPFVVGLEYASGRSAALAGKPSASIYEAALESLRGLVGDPAEVAMVGDDLHADISGAQGVGMQAWLVRTGKYRAEALAESDVMPDRVVDSAAAIG